MIDGLDRTIVALVHHPLFLETGLTAQRRAELLTLMSRFGAAPESLRAATHPIFGTMSKTEWGRWGYRHVDHHLRQFGL